MSQQPADRMQRHFAEAGITAAGKQRLFIFPEGKVRVHARAVVREDRLGHESGRLVVAMCDVLDDILVDHHLVRHGNQAVKLQVDF